MPKRWCRSAKAFVPPAAVRQCPAWWSAGAARKTRDFAPARCAARCGITRASNACCAARRKASRTRRSRADRGRSKPKPATPAAATSRYFTSIRIQRSIRSLTTWRRSHLIFCCGIRIPPRRHQSVLARLLKSLKMSAEPDLRLRALPSVDDVLRAEAATFAIRRFGRPAAVAAVRQTLDAARGRVARWRRRCRSEPDDIASTALAKLVDGSAIELASRFQSHRHGAAHQSRPRAFCRSGGRSGDRRHAFCRRARIRSGDRQAR